MMDDFREPCKFKHLHEPNELDDEPADAVMKLLSALLLAGTYNFKPDSLSRGRLTLHTFSTHVLTELKPDEN